jgi:circadian clock protein KaiB
MTLKKRSAPVSKKTPVKTKSPDGAVRSSIREFEKMLRGTASNERYELKLYVTGASPRSGQAIANVRALCEEYLAGRFDLEVIDIYQQPAVAVSAQIVAAPTLIKQAPAPVRRMIGDLSNRDKILVGLNIIASPPSTSWVAV